MPMLEPIDTTLVLGYVAICIAIGWYSARNQTSEDYMIHGRSLGTFGFFASVAASFIGGGAVVGFTAYVYEFGAVALSIYVALFLSFLAFVWYAPFLREMAHRKKFHTVADYFYGNFGKRTGIAVAVVVIVSTFMAIINQFIAGSAILAEISGLTYETALLLSGSVVLLYLLLGGFRSVVKTDIFQYIVMVVLLFALGLGMAAKTGIDPSLLDLGKMSPALLFAFIIYGLVLPFSTPDIYQKIYAARDDAVVRKGLALGGFFILLLAGAIGLIGLAARTAFPSIDPASAAAYGLVNILPPGLLGLGLLVLFAAIMSSTDTAIFYFSTSIAKDFFGHLGGRMGQLQSITRWSVLLVTISGVGAAYFFRDIIALLIAIAGISVSVVPPMLASFHFKLKKNAVLSAVIASVVYVIGLMVSGNFIPELVIASLFISAIVLGIGQMVFSH